MGCSRGDSECFDWEKPAHRVTITKGFWIEQTEVTVGAYKRFAAATGRQMPTGAWDELQNRWVPARKPSTPGLETAAKSQQAPSFNSGWANDNMPIVGVTWHDANAYCMWAGGRLPTEAEW